MIRHRTFLLGAVTAGVGIMAFAGTASAHVSIAQREVTAGGSAIVTFNLPHGCGESPTTELRIQIPQATVSVTPTRNANWEVDKVMETLAEPVTGSHGETISERVAEVVYTAKAPLPAGYRDVFELSVPIPADAAGTTLYFPTVQTCEEGEEAWIEIPAEGQDHDELDSPSPSVAVVAPADASDDGDGSDDGPDTLAIIALAVGAVGVILGGVALVRGRTG